MITIWVIPVPIPNTEVKPNSAENTCELPCWEDRLLPVFFILFVKDIKVCYYISMFLYLLLLKQKDS